MDMDAQKAESGKELYLNAEKFEFLLIALTKLVEPLIGHEKFRVTLEKDPEQRNVTVKYHF